MQPGGGDLTTRAPACTRYSAVYHGLQQRQEEFPALKGRYSGPFFGLSTSRLHPYHHSTFVQYHGTVDASQNRSQPERVGAKGKPMTRPMLPKDGKGRLRIPPRHWDDESKRDQNPMRTQSPTPLMFGLRSRRRPATKAIWQVEGGSFRRRLEEPVNGSGWR